MGAPADAPASAPAREEADAHGPARELWPADLVYDGLGRPRQDAAVLVQTRPEPARVVTIGHAHALRAEYPTVPVRPVRRVIAPAPVNAHTHLDLSRMPLLPGAYIDFIGRVVAHARAGGRGLAAAEQGLAELESAGVATVGDIVTDERVLARLLAHPGLQGVAYWEVLAPDPDEADTAFEAAVDVVRRLRQLERPGGMRLGLSPHTPHTVSAPLLRKLAALARAERLPLQIHVAEDPGELRLHLSGDGPLREAMGPFLARFRPSGRTPIGYLDELGVLAARPTLVHAVHVVDDDIRRLQQAGCAVVHCPRSNALLRSGTFPWAAYARHGVSVALGTDSRGSSPSLSPVDEWRAAVAIHGPVADPAQLLWSAVKGGHRALGTQPPRVVRGSPASALSSWPEGVPWPVASADADADVPADADAPTGAGALDDVRGGPA